MITLKLSKDQAIFIRAQLAREVNDDPDSHFKECLYDLVANAIAEDDKAGIELMLKVKAEKKTHKRAQNSMYDSWCMVCDESPMPESRAGEVCPGKKQ